MATPRERIAVTLKKGFASEVAIDGFGILKRADSVAISAPEHVARQFRASSMFDVAPLPEFDIRTGETPVKLEDSALGLITKGPEIGPWLVQVPGEEQERTVATEGMELSNAADLFAAAKAAYKDPWKIPRWLSVALAAGLEPPAARGKKPDKEKS